MSADLQVLRTGVDIEVLRPKPSHHSEKKTVIGTRSKKSQTSANDATNPVVCNCCQLKTDRPLLACDMCGTQVCYGCMDPTDSSATGATLGQQGGVVVGCRSCRQQTVIVVTPNADFKLRLVSDVSPSDRLQVTQILSGCSTLSVQDQVSLLSHAVDMRELKP